MNYLFPTVFGGICFWRYYFKGNYFWDDATLIGLGILRAYHTIIPSKQKNIKWEIVTPKILLIENSEGVYKKTNFAYINGTLIAKSGDTTNAVLIYEMNGNTYKYNILSLFDEIHIDLHKTLSVPKDSLPNYLPQMLAAETTENNSIDFSHIINQYAGPMGDFHGDKIKLCEMIDDDYKPIVNKDDIVNTIDNNATESTMKGNTRLHFNL